MYTERPEVGEERKNMPTGGGALQRFSGVGWWSKIVLKYIKFSSLLTLAQTGANWAFVITESGFDKKKKKVEL